MQGSCMCGEVRLVIKNAPSLVGVCHCQGCRMWTGSFGLCSVICRQADVDVKGELVTFYDDGVNRKNCAKCFSCIMASHESSKFIEVCGGILATPMPPVQAHFNFEQRVIQVNDGIPKFKGLPAELGGAGDLLGQDRDAYMVPLVNDGTRDLGLSFRESEAARISSISEGSIVFRWNQVQIEKKQVDKLINVYDRLMSVNGISVTNNAQAKKLLGKPGKMVLVMARFMHDE
eukprot:TRINITY_DN23994_c0_g2_i2.p1 TRINITY_DN23994_c0_g2~~TRINITY_DN23994_c0_g2_i2.p1  ORF type:complete len:231 (+),score=43.69 TRINITY_DN23994_c0_g2_i2:674-1366(+)